MGPAFVPTKFLEVGVQDFTNIFQKKMLQKKTGKAWPIRETNIIPENGPSQKKFHLPTIDTIDFHAQADSFREGNNQKEF